MSYLWPRYGGKFPVYTVNISAIHRINDTSGEFYLNLRKNLLYLDLNMTKGMNNSWKKNIYITLLGCKGEKSESTFFFFCFFGSFFTKNIYKIAHRRTKFHVGHLKSFTLPFSYSRLIVSSL